MTPAAQLWATAGVLLGAALVVLARWRWWVAVGSAVLVALPAFAAPPPEGSEDWQIMHSFRDWVTSQHADNGYYCCDLSDGRPVDARINKEGDWEAHVTDKHYPGASDHWVVVPRERILHRRNPVGVPILWYSIGTDHVFCFAPPDGV